MVFPSELKHRPLLGSVHVNGTSASVKTIRRKKEGTAVLELHRWRGWGQC
jgi:hypothetical protein